MEPGLQADLPTVCVQPHEVLLLEGDAEERDLVPGLVRGPVQALGLEHDEERLHKVLDALLHRRAVLVAGVEGHVRARLLRDLPLQPKHEEAGVVQRGTVDLLLHVELLEGLRPVLS